MALADRSLCAVVATIAVFVFASSCSNESADDATSGGRSGNGATGGASAGAAAVAGTASGGAPSGGIGASAGVANPGGTSSGGGVSGASGAAGAGAATGGVGPSGAGGATATGGASGSAGESLGGSPSGGAAGSTTGGAGASAGSGGRGGTAGAAGAGSGASGTGGSGGADPSCSGADPTELALVKAWLNNTTSAGALPMYAYTNIRTNFPAGAAFNRLSCSIAMSCREFAPLETNWLRKCEALITSAIVAESSYNPASVVVDSYAMRQVGGMAANDPTVGLLQIRFSSTVHDYNYYGPMAKMSAIGCSWPSALTSQADNATFWATAGGTTYLTFMQDAACNIGLATWYYLYNATGNGGANAVWISDYCAGRGVAGNVVVGLLSHLLGGNFTRPADANNAYPWGIECCTCGNPSVCSCTGCTGRVAAFLGIGTSAARPSPDPFTEALVPEVSKYCR